MKKALLLAAVAGLMAVSCKKNYTCECTTTSTDPNDTPDTYSYSLGKQKKKDAESKCKTFNDSWTAPGGIDSNNNIIYYTYTDDCKLK